MHERVDKLARVHFNRLGHFNFAGTGKKLVRAHTAQIRAQRILGEPGGLFRREHRGGVLIIDILTVIGTVTHEKQIVLIGRHFKDADRHAAETFSNLLKIFRRAHRTFRQVVVDFLNRHPAAGTPQANQRAVAVLSHIVRMPAPVV